MVNRSYYNCGGGVKRNAGGNSLLLLLFIFLTIGSMVNGEDTMISSTNNNNNNANNNLIHDDTSTLHASEILLKVYDETRGLRWNTNTNWIQDTNSVCTWYGVTCYTTTTTTDQRRVGHVQKLDLSSNSLVGTLPSIVYELPYLEVLDVKDNVDLTVIFNGIEKAQYLKELSISDTHTTTLEGIENAANSLQTLHMTNLGMIGSLPPQLFQLTNLVGLFANYNKFSSTIPNQIGNLHLLKELYLFNNDLTGQIPTEIGLLSQLQVLTLAENAFSGTLPTTLSNLSNLVTLAINRDDSNSLKGIGISGPLPTFEKLDQINDIRFQNQKLQGSIPTNFLQQAPTQTTIKVDLSGNQLSGTVPTNLQHLKRLNLLLTNNQISSVPNELCNAIPEWMDGDVQTLGCDAFLCQPGTSSSLGRATSTQPCTPCTNGATYWGSTRCAFSTTTSSTTGSTTTTTASGITERETLVTFYNRMGGRYWKNDDGWLNPSRNICEWYGVKCNTNGKVTGLTLQNNELSDTPPNEIFTLPELTSLDLSSNSIKFNFNGIAKATKLETLILANCDLDSFDGIEGLGKLPVLSHLDLSNNYYQGQLPGSILQIGNLKYLDLSHNRLSGTISQQIGDLVNLEHLDVSKNRLNGQFPTTIGKLVGLRELLAFENEFSGVLPVELNSLTSLESISLHQTSSSNSIGGSLPEFRDLTKLTSLQLDSNSLTGTLPSAFLENTQQGWAKIDISLSDNRIQGNSFPFFAWYLKQWTA